MRRASKVSSGTAIAAAIEVSLKSEMKVEPSAGSTLRSMIGRRIEQADLEAAEPDREAGVDGAARHAGQAGAEHLGEVGAGVEGERDDEALDLAEADAEVGQGEEGGEHDDEERRVAHRRHVGRDGGAQRPRAGAGGEGAGEPDDGACEDRSAGHRQPEQEPGQEPVGIAPDHAEMERVVHARAARA